jgi:predicted naringenin-chalcone synthase
MSEVHIHHFKKIYPKHRLSQNDLLSWIIKCHQSSEEKNKTKTNLSLDQIEKFFTRFGVKENQISHRMTDCDDILITNFEEMDLYRITESTPFGADLQRRTEFFSKKSLEVFLEMYKNEIKKPDHIIHVSCTGYISPSAPQKIVASPDWNHATAITHAYHMGCYASLPAVRMAQAFVRLENTPSLQVDVVHNEMCSLHMNPSVHTPEQMVVQTLFADGHIKYSLTSSPQGKSLKVLAVHEKVIPDSAGDMSWIPAPFGMQMNLSREVPVKIKKVIEEFSSELFHKAHLSKADGLKAIYAVHPGGPKIIESVQETLKLSENQVIECKKVLFERGNMSSATLPHVWQEILNNHYPKGSKVISFAFGPGLTLFGAVFEVSE